ncbi:TOBE domain-containing protein [Streptomyces leeuwenhoekii]|uniref:TOBE domain-containing protein n=1 Tax=Streptomyces leeuwenhoekii TaxID=1437453 RepID=UPI00369D0EBD
MIVTHERAEAYALGDRMALVMAGTTSQTGEVGEVMDTPVTAAAARALGFDNLLPASRIAPGTYQLSDVRHLHLPGITVGPAALIAIRAEHLMLRTRETIPGMLAEGSTLAGTVTEAVPEGPLTRTRVRLPDGST